MKKIELEFLPGDLVYFKKGKSGDISPHEIEKVEIGKNGKAKYKFVGRSDLHDSKEFDSKENIIKEAIKFHEKRAKELKAEIGITEEEEIIQKQKNNKNNF
jgi:hypothetical protein